MLGKVGFACLQAAEYDVGIARVQTVGFSWDRIAFVDERAAAFFSPGIKRREGSEASHAEHDINLVITNDFPALLHALPQADEKAQHLGRPWFGHGQKRHLLKA